MSHSSFNTQYSKVALVVAYLATALLTLIPFFQVGFTTGDDLLYFQTTRHGWNYWMDDARIYAETQGRFYFLITKIFYYVPYLIDNFAYTKAVQYVTLIACYALVSYFVCRLFRSARLGLIMLLFLILDTAITANNHIPTIAYPFYFSFSLIVFTSSLLLYMNYRVRGGYWRLILSALHMFFTFLFYEMYLLFAPVLLLIVMRRCPDAATVAAPSRNGRQITIRNLRFSLSEVLPFFIVALLYVACYVGYRRWLVATDSTHQFYDGATFAAGAFSIEGFFRVLWRCTRGVLPWQYFIDSRSLMQDNSLLLGGHSNSLWRMLTHAPAVVWINALLQVALLWWLTHDDIKAHGSRRSLLLPLFVALFLAFFSHVLIAITPKYNQEWSQWMRGYVTSFFSMFALMAALALIVAGTLRLCKRQSMRRLWRAAWCLFVLLLSVLTGYSNHHVGREWSKSQHRFAVIDQMAREGAFEALPDDAVICIDELLNTSWVAYDISKGSALGKYINMRAGRTFSYLESTDQIGTLPSDKPLYYLHAAETKKACELLISLARVEGNTCRQPDSLLSQQAEVYYLSPTKDYTLFYEAGTSWKALPYAADNRRQRLTHITLQDSAINPRAIYISDMQMPNP